MDTKYLKRPKSINLFIPFLQKYGKIGFPFFTYPAAQVLSGFHLHLRGLESAEHKEWN
jgi:hypothetical protein